MSDRIERIKFHFKENRRAYIAGTGGLIAGAFSVLAAVNRSGNTATIDSYKLINWKSPHISETIQVLIPPRGNAGNAIQDDTTGIVYPSQNLAAQELDLNPGNLSAHLHGKKDSVKGKTFTQLTENGEPLSVA